MKELHLYGEMEESVSLRQRPGLTEEDVEGKQTGSLMEQEAL